MKYVLEEPAKFGEDVIVFLQTITRDEISRPTISQLIRSATSVGENYCEANEASSKKDSRNKISICKKATNEIKHWSRMLAKASAKNSAACRKLWKKAHELVLIFATVIKSAPVT